MNRRPTAPLREWRQIVGNSKRIDLSGYASAQHRRFLKAESEQAPKEQIHH